MRVIIHDAELFKGSEQLALNAALSYMDRKPGEWGAIKYHGGEVHLIKRNKASVSVWIEQEKI